MSQGVKYGPAHYAHFACYLESGKPLAKLTPRKVRSFPVALLLEHGRLEEASLILGAEDRISAEDA